MSTPVQKAAGAIMLLINNRPVSPSPEEIVAIIEHTMGKPDSQSGFTPTISSIAAELPGLYDLREAMGTGETFQDKREEALHGTPSRPKAHNFEMLQDRAHVQVEALESLMLLLEPENADEALSLLLLTDSAFEAFAAEAYDEQELSAAEEALWNKVTRAHHALVRRLHRRGAVSPLSKDHFTEGNLVPPSERTAAALEAAKELKEWLRTQVGAAQ
jgi:hypothetical protein